MYFLDIHGEDQTVNSLSWFFSSIESYGQDISFPISRFFLLIKIS